ncbi:CEP68 protein, partial [Penelope pileata]|nr:CEP68 protein [Penelope pileata]
VRKMSSYQADYWACAIPDSLPPSPDRRSPHWDPNKEYEELLDYAYPLKPRYKAGKMPEPFFHDSGVDLDSFSLSPEGTLRSTSVYGRGWQAQGGRENGHLGAGAPARRHSTPAAGKPGWAGAASPYKLSPIAKASFAKSPSSTGIAGPSRGFAKDLLAELSLFDGPSVDGRSWGTRGSPFPHHKGKAKGAERFLPTTRVLPLRREWDGDEEFLSLPPRLQELERLSQVLSDLSLTIRTPREGNGHIVPPSDSRGSLSSTWAPLGGAGSRGSAGPCHPRSWDGTGLCGDGDPLPRAQLPTSSGDGRHRSELSPAGHPRERGQQGESLAQCVKVFCRQLQELLRWLYDVADTTEGWKPPTPNAASVRAALHRYVEFRKDVADHRSLTESVLQHGAALLECMASNSPALKDTLGLIEKQSEELESHAERLYQSVLAALGPGQGEDGSSRQPAALHQAQWVS